MNFTFTCPNCSYKITAADFKENESILANLKEIFQKHEADYISILEKNLVANLQQKNDLIVSQKLTEAENIFQKEKQIEIDKLNQLINNQKIELSNFDLILQKKLIEQENAMKSNSNENEKKLQEEIFKLRTLVENNKSQLDLVVAEKEKALLISKQKEIEEFQKVISEQKLLITSNQNEVDKIKLEFQKENLEKVAMAEKLLNSEISKLQTQIKELEHANILNKVIQNKTKGENFEHEVEGELRKVFEPGDIIEKITSQEKKADYLHTVRNNNEPVGKIVYEVKNADWSNAWEKKLTEDMARQKSKYGILVATSFNKKYLGIPFKRSDENPNIYLCDPESFIFVGQIIKSLILVEDKLNNQKNNSNLEDKIANFNQWKDTQLPVLNKLFFDSLERIKASESGITKQVDEIRIAREKMYNNWQKNIKDYLENFIF
ncbi:hypothetical protein SSABA_v1c08420 [Spiroplasma sabaudiense Ar-1343]|uniref:DUF2130 domain-containing protein n=1 Tax=Spiroplasma sabaudiense Ar-1343 TaxID=1276257 RepID=W6AB79_9MOLU|nr:DUF2130 domain-containing protein [Spiroplasma sabaudiense]AHI54241.1 hypothetical protein SSABA_v1c08420 [Spiroplasma sabaudiense Ar-1343]